MNSTQDLVNPKNFIPPKVVQMSKRWDVEASLDKERV